MIEKIEIQKSTIGKKLTFPFVLLAFEKLISE